MYKGEGAEVDQEVAEAEEEGLGGSSGTGSHRSPNSGYRPRRQNTN